MVKYVKMQPNKNIKSGRWSFIIIASICLAWVVGSLLWPATAWAADCSPGNSENLTPAEQASCAIRLTDPDGQTIDSQQTVNQTLEEVLNIFKYIIGVASVIVILSAEFPPDRLWRRR